MDHGAKLVMMANQIAAFFQPYSEDEAVAGIREHIEAFWTKSMRRDIMTMLRRDGNGLDRRVVLALDEPEAGHAAAPTRRETAGPGQVGEMVSDAG